ncbi:nucleoside diphosphate kinase homolog 5 isoform X1 [Chamaea fasciata]|uniref:nucleoside diphosphate kinase homolog 5 isoform X1 n=1 Tax=Chamaea fasciata TaxID=190680 RepID=UPI003369E9AB
MDLLELLQKRSWRYSVGWSPSALEAGNAGVVHPVEEKALGRPESPFQKRKLQLSPEQCSNFYAEQFGKVFFPNLTAYMSSGPIVAMILARNCAVSYWKELLGPSNSLRARITHAHSLRALYGTDELRNGLHGSLTISSAEKEIRFIFPEAILEPIPTGQRARDYLNLYVKPTLLAGLTALCKEKPADPMIWLADWLMEHNPNKPKLRYGISQ